MDYKESMISDCQKTVKIKASHAQIVVGGPAENPVYSILYFDTEKCDWYIGWSSRNLVYVQTWLKEEFEPGYKRISDFITNLLAREKEAEARAEKAESERDAAIKELDGVSSVVGDLADFIDEQIHPIVPYNMYTDLMDNVYAITMWEKESEWRGQKEE